MSIKEKENAFHVSEDNEMRLVRALIERGREIDLLKTEVALYSALLTPDQRNVVENYIAMLKRGRENK